MDSNPEQTLADIESDFEKSKAERMKAKHRLDSARGKYHTQLVARREAGKKLTVSDIKALEASAIDDVKEIRAVYLEFIDTDTIYRQAKVKFEAAKRDYWDSKEIRR